MKPCLFKTLFHYSPCRECQEADMRRCENYQERIIYENPSPQRLSHIKDDPLLFSADINIIRELNDGGVI